MNNDIGPFAWWRVAVTALVMAMVAFGTLGVIQHFTK